MSKRTLLTLLLAGSALSTAQAAYTAPTYGKIDGNVTLEFWSWVNGMDQTVKGFEKLYPNVKINVTNPGAGNDGTYPKLQTALKAGTGAPDAVQIEMSYLPGFTETGGLVDLNKYGAATAKNYFVPWTWNQVSPDGKAVYAIPQDTGPFAMVYNKAVFDKYGLKVPTTWDEYAKTAATLSQKSGGKVKMGNFFPDQSAWFNALVWAAGGRPWQHSGDTWTQALDNPQAVKVAAYWGDLVKKGYVGTIKSFSPQWYKAVGDGTVATTMEAAWGPGFLAGSVDKKASGTLRVAPLPQWTAGTKRSTGNWGGSSTAVTTQSKNPQAAAIFALWLNSSQDAIESDWKGQALFPAANAGLALPVLHNTSVNPSLYFGKQDLMGVYARASQDVNTGFVWAPWLQNVNGNFTKQFTQAAQSGTSFTDALKRWQTETLNQAKTDGYDVKGN